MINRVTFYLIAFLLVGTTATRLGVIIEQFSFIASLVAFFYIALFLAIFLLAHRGIWLIFFCCFTFGFFGDQPPSVSSQMFDFVLSLFALCFWVQIDSLKKSVFLNVVSVALLAYLVIVTSSLLKLPFDSLIRFYTQDFFLILTREIYGAYAEEYLYSVNAILRLWTLYFLIVGINHSSYANDVYKHIFLGLFASAVFVSLLGTLDFYGLIQLPTVELDVTRLQSVFGHPGWFAEFVTVAIPFVLVLFSFSKNRSIKILLFLALILCEIALILAQARAGWITYPITLFFCWMFFYASKSQSLVNFGKHNLAKIAISIPITIAASVALILLLNELSILQIDRVDGIDIAVNETWKQNESQIINKASRMFDAKDRLTQWLDGYYVGRESILAGMGYESYRWFANLLGPIPGSHLNNFHSSYGINPLPTPHNFYVSLFVSNGVVGVALWLLLIAVCFMVLIIDFVQSKNTINVPVGVSILSFHIYGVFQSTQYIALIIGTLYLALGYVMLRASNLTSYFKEYRGSMLKIYYTALVVALSVLCWNYISDFGSDRLAKKYGLTRPLLVEQKVGGFNYATRFGFHRVEHWNGVGAMSWSSLDALIMTRQSGFMSLPIYVMHPDISEEDVVLKVLVNGIVDQTVVIDQRGRREIALALPQLEKNLVGLKVSRGFRPIDFDGRDTRLLGIAVGELQVQGIKGMHQLEKVGDLSYRWTSDLSSICMPFRIHKLKAESWVAHPNVTNSPIVVTVSDGSVTIRNIYHSTEMRELVIEGLDSNCITINTEPTWSPFESGVSIDHRRLGVALSKLRINGNLVDNR